MNVMALLSLIRELEISHGRRDIRFWSVNLSKGFLVVLSHSGYKLQTKACRNCTCDLVFSTGKLLLQNMLFRLK